MKKSLSILATIFVLFLTQCTPPLEDNTQTNSGYLGAYDTQLNSDGSFRRKGYWDGDDLKGKAQIRISLEEQLAYFYKGGELAGISPISTGMGGYDTPRGNFRISQKKEEHNSTLYGVIVNAATDQLVNDDADSRKHKPGAGEVFKGAPMNFFMRFNGSIGMHTGYIPGYAASHGCVRLPQHMAKTFFANAPKGTEVKVGY